MSFHFGTKERPSYVTIRKEEERVEVYNSQRKRMDVVQIDNWVRDIGMKEFSRTYNLIVGRLNDMYSLFDKFNLTGRDGFPVSSEVWN